MTPFLDRFFGTMQRYLTLHPREPEWVLGEFEGWDAAPERINIYGRFVEGHVRRVTATVFPACRELVEPEVWNGWLDAYYRTLPAGDDVHINGCARGFPEFLAGQPDLPPWLLDLARFEWAKLEVYYDPERIPAQVERLTVNPTLQTLEHPWRICSFYAHREEQSGAPPEPGEEIALIWRNPKTRFNRWRSATPRSLLVLKLALEGISLGDAAREGGVEVSQIEDAVRECGDLGLVLVPPGLLTER